jgi:hypothetical protein
VVAADGVPFAPPIGGEVPAEFSFEALFVQLVINNKAAIGNIMQNLVSNLFNILRIRKSRKIWPHWTARASHV